MLFIPISCIYNAISHLHNFMSSLCFYTCRYTVPGIYNPEVCAGNDINSSCTNFPQPLTVENRIMSLYIEHDSLLQMPGPSADLDFEVFTAPGEFPTNISCLWMLADGRNFRFVLFLTLFSTWHWHSSQNQCHSTPPPTLSIVIMVTHCIPTLNSLISKLTFRPRHRSYLKNIARFWILIVF